MQGWSHEGIFRVSVIFIVFHRIIEAMAAYSMSRSYLAGAAADQLRRGRRANMSTHFYFPFF